MVAPLNIDCQKLLLSLKVTVEGLLVNQVTNVWNIYGGLNRLHLAVEKIFKHGCKKHEEGEADCWTFIEGLSELQPSLSIDISTGDVNMPGNIRDDKSLTWIYKNLEEHLLSKNLFWLLSDPKHLADCYEEKAFLRQEKYAEAAILCLKAVEQNQPSLLTEIDPSLYVTDVSSLKFQKYHKRCSSLPEAKYRFFNNLGDKKSLVKDQIKSLKPLDNAAIDNSKKMPGPEVPETSTKAAATTQSKLSNSLPNLAQEVFEAKQMSRVVSPAKLSPDILQVDYAIHGAKSSEKENSVEMENNGKYKTFRRKKMVSLHNEKEKEWFVVQGKKEERKKTFMEDGGTSVLPMSTAYFPRPAQGQSLTSFLSSEYFSRTVPELDRENAHFSISEAMISAIEQMKCNRQLRVVEDVNEEDSDEEINQLKQRIRLRRRQRLEEKNFKHLWSASLLSDGKTDTTTDQSVSPLSTSPETPSESISTDDVDDLAVDEGSNLNQLKNSDMSVSMASLYSEADLCKTKKEAAEVTASAENVALSLLKQFKKKQLPRASDLEWLVSEEDAPQELLPLPKSWPVSPDDAEHTNVPSLRGTTDWAPPRPQIIFTQHPTPVRRTLLGKQNFRCAGCGLRVAPEYAHKFRYCEYLGRYFCTGCHSNQLSVIPGHILFKWNFKRYPVSTFSYRLIDQMSTDPLFPIKDLQPDLYKKVKALDRTRHFRLQLYYLKDFLFTCRFAQQVQEDIEKEPPHMLQDPEMYSLQDLVQVKTGDLVSRLKELVKDSLSHVQSCQLCSARGFVCELCPSKEAIFPWFIDKVSRCPQCGACFHLNCFKSGFCPRCARASARKQHAFDSDF